MKHTVSCLCCGSTTASVYLGLYGEGQGPTGCKSWICDDCGRRMPTILQGARQRERVTGKPALQWSTVAKAEQLARSGAGWTADHVMRQALAMLEQDRAGRKGVTK